MGGICQGGSILKQMDNAAGVVAFKHCRSNVVTVSVQRIDLKVGSCRTLL